MMIRLAQIAMRRADSGSRWTLGRVLALVLCLSVLIVPMRPAMADAKLMAHQCQIFELDQPPLAEMPDEADAGAVHHGFHCSCCMLAPISGVTSTPASAQPPLRFTGGPAASPDIRLPLDPRPPRT